MSACTYLLFGSLQLFPALVSVTSTGSQFVCENDGVRTCVCGGRVVVPQSCDPSALQSEVSHLLLGTDHFKPDTNFWATDAEAPNLSGFVDSSPGEMSVFGPNASVAPVPYVTHVESVKLLEFDLDGEGARRFNSWLRNVKHSVFFLRILNGRLTKLSGDLLAGFGKLETLEILSAGLKVVERSAFATLSSDVPPALKHLGIQFNKLFAFDWAVLQPIGPSLEELNLFNTSLSVMSASTALRLPKLFFTTVEYNNLTRIPPSIVEIWRNPRHGKVNLLNNPLCAKADCSCCSLLPLINLVRFEQERKVKFMRAAFDCGDSNGICGYLGNNAEWSCWADPLSTGSEFNREANFPTNSTCKKKEDVRKIPYIFQNMPNRRKDEIVQ